MRSPLVLKKFCLIKLDSICRAWSRGASMMSRVGSAVGVRILRTLRGCLAVIILFAILLSGTVAASAAAANRSAPASEEATPPQIQQLLTLLADPKVQTWLKQQNETRSAATSARDAVEESPSHVLDAHLGAIREHIVALADTIPDVPNQFERGAARV